MSTVTTTGPRLKQMYDTEIRAALQDQLELGNIMELPRLSKIVVNMGVGDAVSQAKLLEGAIKDLTTITGQRPITTRAKKSIAGFKVRDDMPLGCKVTLRGDRMYEFLDRLITVALPRVRDFRGLNPKSFDGRGNFAMGLKEHIVFPEIDYDKVDTIWGMDIIVCTSANTNEEAKELLRHFNFPFPE